MLADTEVRMDFLRMAVARGRYLGMDLDLISAKEAQDLFPLLDPKYFVGALYDPVEGHVDPSGVTRAYAKCAQMAGAEIHRTRRWSGCRSGRTGRGMSRSRAATRSTPSTSSTPAACGPARSAGWWASSCRSSPWSTSTC